MLELGPVSPVRRLNPKYSSNGGNLLGRQTGPYHMNAGVTSIFMGICSGRIYTESDLGKVWKRSAIKELIDAA